MILDKLHKLLTTGYTVTGYDILLFALIYTIITTIIDNCRENKK